jgi:hypothetical protein
MAELGAEEGDSHSGSRLRINDPAPRLERLAVLLNSNLNHGVFLQRGGHTDVATVCADFSGVGSERDFLNRLRNLDFRNHMEAGNRALLSESVTSRLRTAEEVPSHTIPWYAVGRRLMT